MAHYCSLFWLELLSYPKIISLHKPYFRTLPIIFLRGTSFVLLINTINYLSFFVGMTCDFFVPSWRHIPDFQSPISAVSRRGTFHDVAIPVDDKAA